MRTIRQTAWMHLYLHHLVITTTTHWWKSDPGPRYSTGRLAGNKSRLAGEVTSDPHGGTSHQEHQPTIRITANRFSSVYKTSVSFSSCWRPVQAEGSAEEGSTQNSVDCTSRHKSLLAEELNASTIMIWLHLEAIFIGIWTFCSNKRTPLTIEFIVFSRIQHPGNSPRAPLLKRKC